MILNGTDSYPSRRSHEVTLLERHDPVVHGTADDGPLDQAALDEFDARGFLQLPDVFGRAEVADIEQELDRMATDPAVRADDASVVDADGAEVRSIFDVTRFSDVLTDLLRDPRVADAARQLVGSDVYLHQSRINDRPGFVGNAFEWHADFETWHVEDGMPRPRAVSAAIAVTDHREQNGPLLLMPGSHWTYVTTVGEAAVETRGDSGQPRPGMPDEKSLRVLADRHGIASCTGRAGSVVLFDSNAMHGSNGNITPYRRSTVFAAYNSVENTLGEPFGPGDPRPEHVASRDFAPLPSSGG